MTLKPLSSASPSPCCWIHNRPLRAPVEDDRRVWQVCLNTEGSANTHRRDSSRALSGGSRGKVGRGSRRDFSFCVKPAVSAPISTPVRVVVRGRPEPGRLERAGTCIGTRLESRCEPFL
jgi:hypothetical protein